MTGLLLALGVLLLAALGLPAWETLSARTARRVAPWATLAVLLAAFVLSTAWPNGATNDLSLCRLLADEWGRLMRGLLLLGLVLRLAVQPRNAQDGPASTGSTIARSALHLLGALGAVLAVSNHDLTLLALGVLLYALAQARTADQPAILQRRLGAGALLFGVSLLYATTATTDLTTMGRYLWEHPGPQAAMLYLGGGLTLVGLALLTRLLVWSNAIPATDGTSAVLGVGALVRVCVDTLGALHSVWGWLATGAGLAAMLAGWLRARRRPGLERVAALDAAQRGLLLLTLAFAHTAGGLQAALMAMVAYWLAEAVTTAVIQRLAADAPARADAMGLLTRNPCLAVALLLGLLSLASIPLTLGFAGRAALLWAAPDAPRLALALAGLVVSALCAAEYLPLILPIARAPERDAPLRSPAYVCALLLITAVALFTLGIYPRPFGAWVTLIAP
jgi:NADH-quinone oxidoreductase subunit N